MKLRKLLIPLSLALTWLGSASGVGATPLIIEAGQAHTLTGDVILNGDDVLGVRARR